MFPYAASVYNTPLAYFITFRTYGSWLHGDERGSVDRRHNTFGTPLQSVNDNRAQFEAQELKHEAIELSDIQRDVVLATMHDVCQHKNWTLHAVNVRTNHVHLVVTCPDTPERAMNTFKSYATRRLRETGYIGSETSVWSRHGSTIYIFREDKLAEKIKYVLEQQ